MCGFMVKLRFCGIVEMDMDDLLVDFIDDEEDLMVVKVKKLVFK